MTTLDFRLLDWQRKVFADNARFKIICAGRRCGKTRFSVVNLLVNGANAPKGSDVMYIAPTQGMARKLVWKLLLSMGADIIASSHVNNMEITLINGTTIYVCGADNPDTLRGNALYFVVLDEYAFMKKDIWEEIVRPSLSDFKGKALFISSPEYRNHFYDIYKKGQNEEDEFKSWHFTTYDNETIDRKEIEAAKKTMAPFAFRKEYMASFDTIGSGLFKEEWIKYGDEPENGRWFIACDLAGFEAIGKAEGTKRKLDYSSICVVKVTDDGKWFVKKIEFGRWDVRETAVRILKNIRDFRPMMIGIERGTTMNAVLPYLSDLMRKNSIFAHIEPLSHGNKDKTERIVWALQGLFEHGRIILNKENMEARDSWQSELIDEYMAFPTKDVHDDLMDSLSFIAQMAVTSYVENDDDDDFEPMDLITGY